jgi:hypothetical protein
MAIVTPDRLEYVEPTVSTTGPSWRLRCCSIEPLTALRQE